MFSGNGMKMFWKGFSGTIVNVEQKVRLTVGVDQDIDLSTSTSLFSNILFYISHLNFVDRNQATFNFSVFHQKCHLSELVETDPFLPTFHIFYRQGRTLEHSNSLKPLKLLILGKMEEFLQMGETCKKDV